MDHGSRLTAAATDERQGGAELTRGQSKRALAAERQDVDRSCDSGLNRQDRQGSSQIVNLLFSSLLTAFGSIGLANQLREVIRAWSSSRWPSGEAVVTSAAVHERRGSRGRTVFEPTIEYRYAFRGVDHIGYRIRFGDVATRDRSEADKLAERFAVASAWSVNISERRPEMAVLHPGVGGHLWFTLGFFCVYTSLASAFLVDAVKRLHG